MFVVHILRAYSHLDGQPEVGRSSSQLTQCAQMCRIVVLSLTSAVQKEASSQKAKPSANEAKQASLSGRLLTYLSSESWPPSLLNRSDITLSFASQAWFRHGSPRPASIDFNSEKWS
jgi:hypothetical protein